MSDTAPAANDEATVVPPSKIRDFVRQESVGGAGAPLVGSQRKATIEDVGRALARGQAFADAHLMLQRAIKRGGRDPSEPLTGDSAALQSLTEILISVQDAEK